MTKAEKETIITFNEAEDVAIVYTHNGKIKRDIERQSKTAMMKRRGR